jgi:hypothetical protein
MPKQEKVSPIDALMALTSEYAKYINENNEACICLPETPIAITPIRSSIFRGHCYGEYHRIKSGSKKLQQEGIESVQYKNLTMNSYKEFLDVLEGKIFAEANSINSALRIGKHNNSFYYHLGDGKTCYSITRDNIKQEKPAIVFTHHPQIQATQPHPDLTSAKVEDIYKIFDYINITDQHNKILLITYLISLLNPEINKYILYFHGLKGSSKTTSFRIIRSLIDPCKLPNHVSKDANLVSLPYGQNSETKLKVLTEYHYCLFFDNVNNIHYQLQGELAKMALGQIDAERKLYTNNEQMIYTKKPCIGINGVNQVMTQDELIQRSLIIEIEPIKQRKTDEDVWVQFHRDKPKMLASLFLLFQKTLNIIETEDIQSSKLPRMADASKWMTATAIALGVDKEEFYKILKENVTAQDTESISFSPTAQMIIKFMDNTPSWEGSLGDLHRDIKVLIEDKYKDDIKIGAKPDDFPSSTQKLGMQLKKVIENLNNIGYFIEKVYPKKKDGYHYKIVNKTRNSIEDSFLEMADELDF